jgi:type IV pilus assembly protein PilV
MKLRGHDLPSRSLGQSGFSMLEILVTLFLLMLWLLASAGVQSSSLQFNKAAQFRTQAVYFATELAERMQANVDGAVAGYYTYSGAAGTAPTDCTTATCGADTLAAFDLAEWSARVIAALPSAQISVTPDGTANPITYTIVIGWSDRRDERTYGDPTTENCLGREFCYRATKTLFNPPI